MSRSLSAGFHDAGPADNERDIAPTILAAAGLAPGPKMSGRSFAALLRGDSSYSPRKYVFVERGPHGTAPVTLQMRSSANDFSRSARSDRYKFIYNCTPWVPYSPVDSAGGAGWTQMAAANEQGKLAAGLRTTYFTTPRPVYELYDLAADPSELNNLSGQTAVHAIELELRTALAEKMIVDFDYLPLPDLLDRDTTGTKTGKGGKKKL